MVPFERFFIGRHDTQHKDTQHNDIQHKDTQHNDTQHKGLICDTQHNDIQNKDTQGLYVTLSVSDSQHKQHSAQQCYATVLSAIMAIVAIYLLLC
jgi:hypothetical protein